MRLPFRRRNVAPAPILSPTALILTLSSIAPSLINAITFTPAPAADLDLSKLGRVALAGNFTGVSLYEYEEQNELPYNNNGSESLLARMPNGAFASIVTTDATIQTMCNITTERGTYVVIGGNFTSVQGTQSIGMALFNPNTSEVQTLGDNISGQVNAVYCDQQTNTVYAGGNFIAVNSTNAISWVETQGLTNLPFAGFNGPVTSIAKTSNGNIIFGGSFTGLGNATTPSTPDGQVINLSTAKITAVGSSSRDGFGDPKNIVCKTGGSSGAGNTWLLEEGTAGAWKAEFGFGFRPTKLRLYNTHQDGWGTKFWSFTLPDGGLANFTFVNQSGSNATCAERCPLSDDPNAQPQDFHFINNVGMDTFTINIMDWYGLGGGLNGIELFGDDIFSYAINDFNEPSCAGLAHASFATPTEGWKESESLNSQSRYLTWDLDGPTISNRSASIVFTPDIRESGHYSVNLYTPGCIQDNSCSTRGQVRVTGQMTANGTMIEDQRDHPNIIWQTNDYDKYDQIYFGLIDASSDSFRPQVTIAPVDGQQMESMTFVAQRVGFTLLNSTGGLNGLFEYTPGKAVNTSDLRKSNINKLGTTFDSKSAVNALITHGDTTFIGGNFTSPDVRNIAVMTTTSDKAQQLDGGLNGEVKSMALDGEKLYVGGLFNSTMDRTASGLSNIAVFDIAKNTWSPLGAGVNAQVSHVVLMTMNITDSTPEVVVALHGQFDELLAFGNNPAVSVDSLGIWVPSQNNWLQNLDLPVESINGVVTASLINIADDISLYGGSLASSVLGASAVATLGESLGKLPVNIETTSGSANSNPIAKRDSVSSNGGLDGVVTGLFDISNNRNITILGGHFTATGANGTTINNLLLVDGANNDEVSGIGSDIESNSTFVALAVQGDVLWAGGNVTGTINGNRINGLVAYNVVSKSFGQQPPALSGGNNTVSSVVVRPSTQDIYVGGSFTMAGNLGCPGVCFYSTSSSQWNQPGQNLEGDVRSLMWVSDTVLLAGGRLAINNTVPTSLARYDAGSQMWDIYPGSDQLPGPVDIIAAGASDNSKIWVSGTASNGTVYLMKSDGSSWSAVGQTLEAGTVIRGLQIFSLTSSHDSSSTVDSNQVLMLTGSIISPEFGSASAVLFNGTTFRPYALTTNDGGNSAGTISRFFVEYSDFFSTDNSGQLPLGFIVLIGLGISLALMFLIVVAGLFLDRLRKKREGYIPAPTSMYDRGSGIQRIPPHELLEGLGKVRSGAPQV